VPNEPNRFRVPAGPQFNFSKNKGMSLMTPNKQGGFWSRLKLVGQPYWFGSMEWTWWKCLLAIVVCVGTIVGLNMAVATGKGLVLDWMRSLDAQSILAFVGTYWPVSLAGIIASGLVAWYAGKRLGLDSPPLTTDNTKHARLAAWLFLIVVFVFIVVVNVMNVVIANVSQMFTTALNNKNELEYWKWLYAYAMVFIVAIPIVGTNRWVKVVLGAHWRRWLTFHLSERYFSVATRAYYYINGRPDIDNPDERVHEDVRNFTDAALTLLLSVIGALITLIAFSGELWSMNKELTWVVIGYSLGGTILTVWLGRKLAFFNSLQLRYEANFRFSLTRTRENTESIAFYGGEAKELGQAKGRFSLLYRNYRRLVGSSRNVDFFTTGFDYVVIILPSLFLAPLYFKGQIDVGAITKATFAFRMVLGSLELIISAFPSIAKFSANVHRIGSFVEAVENPIETESKERVVTQFGDHVRFDNVTVRTPDGARTLVTGLNFDLKPGRSIVIVGPSGCGKSSILRVNAGLWHNGSGVVTRPEQKIGLKNILFLSQKPYMTLGSLREQILYPDIEAKFSIAELKATLDRVNLPNVVKNVRDALAQKDGVDAKTVSDEDVFNAELNWQDIFSPGEQQRLALARLVSFQPKIAILDEATSALDVKNEALVYGILRQSGASFISVGHRPTLVHHHDEVLELDGLGGWQIFSAEDYAKRMAQQ
jgi:putative ATP-binding cassette transporter